MKDKEAARAEREILQRDALKLASAAGVDAERGMLVPLLAARGRVRYGANDAVVVEYASIYGDWFLTGADIIREMRADADFVRLFETRPASPAKPSPPNPFARGSSWSLTEQFRLMKADPARAAAMKAEAEGDRHGR